MIPRPEAPLQTVENHLPLTRWLAELRYDADFQALERRRSGLAVQSSCLSIIPGGSSPEPSRNEAWSGPARMNTKETP